jgi:hypothetical protein
MAGRQRDRRTDDFARRSVSHSGTVAVGGRGSSSAPTSRSKPQQPLAGIERTLALAGAAQAAALLSYSIPPK